MADTIYVRGEGGTVFEMDLPLPSGAAQRLERGDMQRVNADGTPYTEPVKDVDPFATKRPAQSAPKGDWVVYAVSQGSSVNDADGLTKAELIEKYGSD